MSSVEATLSSRFFDVGKDGGEGPADAVGERDGDDAAGAGAAAADDSLVDGGAVDGGEGPADVKDISNFRWAIKKGDVAAISELLDRSVKPVNIDIDLDGGETPLLYAVACGKLNVVKELLARGCDVTLEYDSFLDPLCLAVSYCRADIVQALLDGGFAADKVSIGGVTALHLLSSGENIDLDKPEDYKRAVETVRALVNNGADVNAKTLRTGSTPYGFAKSSGCYEMINILRAVVCDDIEEFEAVCLNNEIDADFNEYCPDGDPILNKFICRSEGDPLRVTGRSIRKATGDVVGFISVSDALRRPNCDVNRFDPDGRTALHIASCLGYVEIVRALCEKEDLRLNGRDRFGKTALDLAQEYGHEDIATMLRSKGAVEGTVVAGYMPEDESRDMSLSM